MDKKPEAESAPIGGRVVHDAEGDRHLALLAGVELIAMT
jgi:hypothetical protein